MFNLYYGSLRSTTPEQKARVQSKKIVQQPRNSQQLSTSVNPIITNPEKKHQFNHLNKYDNNDSKNYVFRQDYKSRKKAVNGPEHKLSSEMVPINEFNSCQKRNPGKFNLLGSDQISGLLSDRRCITPQPRPSSGLNTPLHQTNQLCSFTKIFNNNCAQKCTEKLNETPEKAQHRKHQLGQTERMWDLLKDNKQNRSSYTSYRQKTNESSITKTTMSTKQSVQRNYFQKKQNEN